MKIRSVLLATVCVAALLQHEPTAAGMRNSKDLTLSCRLAKTIYAEAEPVLAFLSVKNRGKSVRCIPSGLNCGIGLQVVSLEGGERLMPPRWMDSSWGDGLQANIGPGETFAAVLDPLTTYGDYRRGAGSIADRLGGSALPPGRYRLISSLTVRETNGKKGGAYERVQGNAVDFAVVPLEDDTSSAQLVGAFLRSASWRDGEYVARSKYCADWVPRFYSSGFLPTVFRASGSHMKEEPLGALLSALRANGASDIMRANILQTRLIIHPGGGELRVLLEQIAEYELTGPTAEIIGTWATRVARPNAE